MVTQKTPLQKTFEIHTGWDSFDIDFWGANRQFDRLEISIIVYDKSDKHATIYGSYNVEMASIKSIKLTNFAEIDSLTNEKKYDIDNTKASSLQAIKCSSLK